MKAKKSRAPFGGGDDQSMTQDLCQNSVPLLASVEKNLRYVEFYFTLKSEFFVEAVQEIWSSNFA